MIRSPKFWLLFLLLVAPIGVFVGFGNLWLIQKGWWLYGFVSWVVASVLFGILSVRWTRAKGQSAVLPPIDWSSPRTFSPFDLQAWKLVEGVADTSDTLAMAKLTEIDTYLDTGKQLANRLAAHYHPLSTDPIEHVPVIQLLTALELAAEDLSRLCREVPGADMITPSFWKKAVQAAGFFSKANEYYSYLLPLFSPASGIARLGAQKLMTGPAWKSMQQNMLRWFFRAYVNRLGIHMIEMMSGRLVIGADQYRKLTKRKVAQHEVDAPQPLEIAVLGARGSGATGLVEALTKARAESLATLRAKAEERGLDPNLADLLASGRIAEIEGYTTRTGAEAARDRSTRRHVLAEAVDADLVLLTIDSRRDDLGSEVKFVEEWAAFFLKNQAREIPPLIAVLTWIDSLPDESLLGVKIETVRHLFGSHVSEVVGVELGTDPPKGVSDRLLVGLFPYLDKAERVGMIRRIQTEGGKSKARRLITQVARQGKRLFSRK